MEDVEGPSADSAASEEQKSNEDSRDGSDAAVTSQSSSGSEEHDENSAAVDSDAASIEKVVEEDFAVLKQQRDRNNRVAVVILSLGLITTAIALLVVGCRLRTMRRRLRKGRAINSNEADYLINGMYL